MTQQPFALTPKLKPFDLEAAKRGEPIITRAGLTGKFLAHIPEHGELNRVAVAVDGNVYAVSENGRNLAGGDSRHDLFMAPHKQTVYINVWRGVTGDLLTCGYITEAHARDVAINIGRKYHAIAVPIEIEV